MAIELSQHYVAFLDVLGFSDMVAEDVRSNDQKNLSKLFKCHQAAGNIFSDDPNCSITQFSDSIVVAKPYDAKDFDWFVTRVASYQRLLLDEELLCRGGISVNKHFSNGTFTFSAGLIAAYTIESSLARYPRVVVSKEVMDLIFPDSKGNPKNLVREDDGLLFVDYIGCTRQTRPKKLASVVQSVVTRLLASDVASIREKGLWLASYSDAVLGTHLQPPRFER
jgi:CDGSH-type Zn-finger protein